MNLSFIASVIPESVVVTEVNKLIDDEMAKLQAELAKLVNEGLAKVAGGIPVLSGVDSPAVQAAADAFTAGEVAKLGDEIKKVAKDAVDKIYGVSAPAPAPTSK